MNIKESKIFWLPYLLFFSSCPLTIGIGDGICIASIVTGELLLIGFYFGIIPPALALGFLPVIPIVFISFVIILIGSRIKPKIFSDVPFDK
jgi:hypothetical protein